MPRYKYGKIEKTIGLDILDKLMERVKYVDRSGYSVEFIQALIALFYWTGFRRSEILGDKGHKWKLKDGTIKKSKPFPGLLKENMWMDDRYLYVYQKARKHGKRDAPVVLPLNLPYVDLIVQQWKRTKPGQKIFPISYVTFWRILKRIDPKIYPHFFALNRISKLAKNPNVSMAEICAWTGKTPKTVAYYMAREGRFTKEVGDKLLEER